MLTSHLAYLLVASFLFGLSHGAFVRVAHAGQSQPSQNSASPQIDLSQLYPVDIYLNETLVWKDVLYGSVTQYLFVPQGQWMLKANSSASNVSSTGGNININQTILIDQEANYTLAIFPQQSSNTSEGQNSTSQSSLTASLFLEQLNSTMDYAYVKLYNFIPNVPLSLVLLNKTMASSNMSTVGTNETTTSSNESASNSSTSGQQIIIENVQFGNASEYTQINQTVSLQQLALLVNGQIVPLDDFKMNSTYLNMSFVQNFDFRFIRLGDKYSIFAIPSTPVARQFYVFGNDTQTSPMVSNEPLNSSSNTSSVGSTDIITQITRDDLPRPVSYIRFVSGVADIQFSPMLDNSQINPVSIGNASNFYRVYAGLHTISQASQSQPQSGNVTDNSNATSSNTTSGSSQLVLLLPNSLADYVVAGSSSNTTTALVPSNIEFPLDVQESALKLVNLVSEVPLTLMISSQNASSSNTSTSQVMFLKGSNYVVLNSSSYTLQLMQNNQTVALLENVQLIPTTYFTVFAISSGQQSNVTSENSTGSNETSSNLQIQLILVVDTQTIALPIGSYARFIVSLGENQSNTSEASNTTSANSTNSNSTNSQVFTLVVDDVLVIEVNNGDVTEYLSMPSGRRNITVQDQNGNTIGNSFVDILPNSTQSILIFGQQQSLQFAVAQDTRRPSMSIDSVRMRLVNLDVNSQSVGLVQNQNPIISNVSFGNWSTYQDVMAQNLQLSSLSLSGESGQSPIQPIQGNMTGIMGENQSQNQTLNPFFAYSIISLAKQGSSNSSMGVIVSDSTFQIQDICFVRFVHASPDAPAVDIIMNDVVVYTNLMPRNSSFYIPIIKGLFNISVIPSVSSNQTMGENSLNQSLGNETSSSNQSSSAPLLTQLFAFQISSFFTFAIVEPRQNMSYVVIEDKLIPTKQMTNESAQIRLVNLAFDTQQLTVVAVSSEGQEIPIADAINYQDASEYTNIEAGQYTLLVSQGNSDTILKNISLNIVSRNFYTIWITNSDQSESNTSSHHSAFIERQISQDNGAYWLDDIEDWAGSVFDLENDLFEMANSTTSNETIASNSSENSSNFSSSSGMNIPKPDKSFMFGNGRFEDQVFFGKFILNKSAMNISQTEGTQISEVMGQWDRMYRAFYAAKEDPFGLGLALPSK